MTAGMTMQEVKRRRRPAWPASSGARLEEERERLSRARMFNDDRWS